MVFIFKLFRRSHLKVQQFHVSIIKTEYRNYYFFTDHRNHSLCLLNNYVRNVRKILVSYVIEAIYWLTVLLYQKHKIIKSCVTVTMLYSRLQSQLQQSI